MISKEKYEEYTKFVDKLREHYFNLIKKSEIIKEYNKIIDLKIEELNLNRKELDEYYSTDLTKSETYISHYYEIINIDGNDIEIDSKLAPLIKELNKVGLKTLYCCQGGEGSTSDKYDIFHQAQIVFDFTNMNVQTRNVSDKIKNDMDLPNKSTLTLTWNPPWINYNNH